MSDLLAQGAAWLTSQQRSFCSTWIEYRRGDESFLAPATAGKTDYEIQDESGLRIGGVITDFIIASDDLGQDPAVGDIIIANERKYEVLDLGADGAWRWSDPYMSAYRIHTKDIGADD